MIQRPVAASTVNEEEIDATLDLEETGYQANFAKLATVTATKKSYTINEDPSLYLAQSLANLSKIHPGKVEAIIQGQLPQENAKQLNTYMQIAGVSLIR